MTIGNYLYRLRCGDRAVDLMTDPATGGWLLAQGLGGLQAGALSVQYEAGAGAIPSFQRVGSVREPAQITFRAHLVNTSAIGAFLRNLRDVEKFVGEVWLHHEEGARAPIYLERRLDEGYSGTGDEVVLFGRGATYYRVLSIDSISFPDLEHAVIAAGWIPDAEFTLTCDPYAVGKPQFAAWATGWVDFDAEGNVMQWRGGTNLIHNPSFEHSTFNTDWAEEDADLTDSVEYERVRTGWQACKLVNAHATDAHKYTVTLTLEPSVYALSAYVYTDGSAVTSADCVLYGQGSALTTTFEADADHAGWYRAKAIFSGQYASSTHGLQVKALKVVYVDDVQLEELPTSNYGGTNLVLIPGFETAGAGGDDIFDTWVETKGDGTIFDEGALVKAGSHACGITSGATSNSKIAQTITVAAETAYLLTYHTRGQAGGSTTSGRYAVYDNSHTAYLRTAVTAYVTAATYALRSYYFVTPAGCTSIDVEFWSNSTDGEEVYFDSVSLVAFPTGAYPWSPFMLTAYDPGPGIAWAGTAHDSNLTRTYGYIDLYGGPQALRGARLFDPGKGAVCFWLKTPWAGDDRLTHYILYAGSTDMFTLYKGSGNVLTLCFEDIGYTYSKTLSFTVTSAIWPADTWLCLIFTWEDGAPTGLYLYGGTATSDTSVTTVGNYIPMSNLGSYLRLGDLSTGTDMFDGWFGDLRIFGPGATITPALLYAAGRGKSEMPFVWTKAIRDMDNTADSTYSNMGFIANLPGDVPCPCRLIINNPDGADDFSKAYFGIRINGNKTTNLNVFEGTAGTDGTDGADANRSGGFRTRVAPAATTEPAAYNVRFTVVPDGRKGPLVYGRYKIVAVVRDGAAATGVFKARLKTYLNTTGLMETGEWVSASRVDAAEYVLLDMGTFTIPPLNPPNIFLGQTLPQTGDRTAYCNVDMFVWMTSGAGLNFDVDCIVLLPERINGYIYDSAQNWTHGNTILIDALSVPPRTYMTEASSLGGTFPATVTLDPFQRVDVQCDWPLLPPHTWCHVNQVLEDSDDGHLVDDDTIWMVQYQPLYLWGA